ncbi:MAG: excinuclease ABC subunit UvrB [Candidatus Wildermuthbacteria bacterium]|nr:excinuclease ABC subunit UvrB [Candidatus Wildermuthbacteria bacterium]
MNMDFRLVSKFKPTGDQPQAIEKLAANIQKGAKDMVLLGVTGSGKTFTISNVIEKLQRPALVISPNKTLAAQLYQEFKEFFPNNGVHYFVSYYDYYQPEAYISKTDTYIEKDSKINETIDRLRHEAVQDLISRKDIIVVASISCIYNIGNPEEYQKVSLRVSPGQRATRKDFLRSLTQLQYVRNDVEFAPGSFRVRGNIVEIFLVTGKELVRIEFDGDHIESVSTAQDPLSPIYKLKTTNYRLFPAKFWVAAEDKLKIALQNIRAELEERLAELKKQGKLPEASRLEQRTNYDMEMIEETGYCHGIENYSRHLDFRETDQAPFTLLDYFPKDFLVFLDESHLTFSQARAMSVQDKVRKTSLVEHGFRLPSAIDNRPLTFREFLEKTPKRISVSATPGEFEQDLALKEGGRDFIIEQLVRPTGLLEPEIQVRPLKNQMQDVLREIQALKKHGRRALVVALTKRLAEDIAEFLSERGVKTHWLHSEVKTLDRPSILQDLRKGTVDALVGVNLLREGLDLPEVSLVAILDADKEGFLRNATMLIQTMGRAARHEYGKVILYADKETTSMKNALAEIARRRRIQEAYNTQHGIVPSAIVKDIREWTVGKKPEEISIEFGPLQDIAILEKEMKTAAKNLDFERAATIRDLIKNRKRDT